MTRALRFRDPNSELIILHLSENSGICFERTPQVIWIQNWAGEALCYIAHGKIFYNTRCTQVKLRGDYPL